MAKISIIIPIYNSEEYIERCLKSLITQTFPSIEIICIDDGSTDSSLVTIQKYANKDNRIKVISQKNAGPAQARNTGLKSVTAPYLMFCDSDDWYEPTMCEIMYNKINTMNQDIVLCNTHIIEKDLNNYRTQKDIDYCQLHIFGEYKLTHADKMNINVVLWNKIFKMSLINQYNITFPNGYEHDDDAFVYQYLTLVNRAFGLKEKLYNYLLRENSIMGMTLSIKRKKSIFDFIGAYEHIVIFLVKHNLLPKNTWIISIICQVIWHELCKLNDLEKKDFIASFNCCVLSLIDNIYLANFPFLLDCKNKEIDSVISTYFSKEYRLFFISLFKKKATTKKIKYYLFGIQIWSIKHQISLES